ncbi:chemotaxis protein CheW [Pontivivens nitratireducens]|uniref:chemotaxis protein CheW n=1 Tax=Pontivivens nitratireducens TaxID=2758038 RepID=UPI00163998D1|nr:chemotaxis protein CheW [Pontibrevibacter nitratireducens]
MSSNAAPLEEADTHHLTSPEGDDTCQFLSFVVDGRPYGVRIQDVREIRQWMRTTSLPNQPPHNLGVLNLRGSIVSIQDLRIRLGAPAPAPDDTNVIVIVQTDGRRVGLLVDAVSDILTLQRADIQPVPPNRGGGDERAMLTSIIMSGEVMVGIVDLDRVMDPGLSE